MTDLYYLIPIGVLAGTNIAALVGFAFYLRKAHRAQSWAAYYRDEYSRWWNRHNSVAAEARALKTQIDAQASKRSANVAKGNHTRALKAKALRDAITTQLAGEVQAKARELRVAA